MLIDTIFLNSRTGLMYKGRILHAGGVAKMIDTLNTIDVSSSVVIEWQVIDNGPVGIERQNRIMLLRANRIAAGIGKTVESYGNKSMTIK